MSKTYNMIGSLSTLKSKLYENNIHEFKSLKDVMDFQSSYPTIRQQMISHHEKLIEMEKDSLGRELQQLEQEIEIRKLQSEQTLQEEIDRLKQQLKDLTANSTKNLFQKLINEMRKRDFKSKIIKKEVNFNIEVKRSISSLIDNQQYKSSRYQYLISQFREAVNQSAWRPLSEIERKKTTIDNLNSYIYGALGEQKVVKTLETLSDEYFLINDFAVSFSPAIYHIQEQEYIMSIQIDHILVAPSGIFLIETKNWSEKSLENLSLRSPVDQIKRTSFVLFKLLNNEMSNYHLHLNTHHWGAKKIPIKNLIVLINSKPKEEFQYVKILTLKELLGYINYFKPIFSNIETQKIAEYLLNINDQKTIQVNRN